MKTEKYYDYSIFHFFDFWEKIVNLVDSDDLSDW